SGLVTKEKFISDFSVAGKPTIIDLSAFIGLSDQKKIDNVFELYPPKGDVMGLHDQIEAATESLNELTTTIKQTEGVIEKLTADQAEIELPAGTLAEVNQEIERTTAEVKLARKNLYTAQQKEAEKKAAEKAEAAAAENARSEKEILAMAESEESPVEPPANRPQLGGDPGYTARNSEDFQDRVHPGPKPVEPSENPARISIWAIIKTIEKAGCTSCAALLQCKKELRKY
ncbi:MAG: hypothetical protein JRJ39_05115, partial [Deltaproteobacteria bacterium]|nr:hypothetical protein [Deltaproteobacteria bacterium]MBW2364332.1 hypothetical protein [Deltaproteobacteria bacterium]